MSCSVFRINPREARCGMGAISFLHGKKETVSSAYELSEELSVLIKLPRSISADKVLLLLTDENGERLYDRAAKLIDFDSIYDIYKVKLRLLGCGLYFFGIRTDSVFGTSYALNCIDHIEFAEVENHSFQLSVSDFKYKAPTQYYGGVIYHIFVDRFKRGRGYSLKNGAKYVEDWYSPIPEYPEYSGAPIKNDYFYGGTLEGITESLDYIKSLGVNIIYLSPIFDSPSNHKYDTADYMRVDESFGGDEALRELINKADKKGIKILLDGVFNHTGADSIYFNKYGNYPSIGAYQSEKSEYYSWYDFKNHPDDYVSWWGIEILPRINPDIKSCREYFLGDGGVIDKYAKMGIAGLRLDVVDELSDDFVSEVKKKLSAVNECTMLYGEVWEDASNKVAYEKRKSYYLGNELDGVMNYPLRRGLIAYLKYKNTEELKYALLTVMQNAPQRIRDAEMNILGSHDTERIITVLGAEEPEDKSNASLSALKMSAQEYERGREKLLSAFTALFTLPGIPSVFYGDEVGLEGYSDPFNRLAYPWGREDDKLLEYCRKLGRIRRKNSVYKSGEFKLLHLDSDIFAFMRFDRSASYITLVNNSDDTVNIELENEVHSLLDNIKSKRYALDKNASIIFKTENNNNIIITK